MKSHLSTKLKPKAIRLVGDTQAKNAAGLIKQYTNDSDLWVCEFKKEKDSKTLQQLRALFGTWYDYLSDTLGETKDDLHKFHKFGFNCEGGWLVKIYGENPQGVNQEMWAELASEYIEFDDLFQSHLKRISLSWATVDQMREYMTRIEHYYMNAGYPLPVLEKFKRWYA